jgi:SAM-dependent methyltransferase
VREFIDANRRNWDERVPIHRSNVTGFYASAEQLKAGRDTLSPIEAGEIGSVAGQRLLHLQCHFGLDTLSLARRGAVATGVDFSPAAIDAAQSLAADVGLPAQFIETEVTNVRAAVEGEFDIAFSTWGTICWLPDLYLWAAAVAACLKPGGRLYLADAHPTLHQLEFEDGNLVFRNPWRTPASRPLSFQTETTYNGDPTPLTATQTYEWPHPFSEIIGALLAAGLRLVMLNEHDRLPWPFFPDWEKAEGGLWRLPRHRTPTPLAFSIMAEKV